MPIVVNHSAGNMNAYLQAAQQYGAQQAAQPALQRQHQLQMQQNEIAATRERDERMAQLQAARDKAQAEIENNRDLTREQIQQRTMALQAKYTADRDAVLNMYQGSRDAQQQQFTLGRDAQQDAFKTQGDFRQNAFAEVADARRIGAQFGLQQQAGQLQQQRDVFGAQTQAQRDARLAGIEEVSDFRREGITGRRDATQNQYQMGLQALADQYQGRRDERLFGQTMVRDQAQNEFTLGRDATQFGYQTQRDQTQHGFSVELQNAGQQHQQRMLAFSHQNNISMAELNEMLQGRGDVRRAGLNREAQGYLAELQRERDAINNGYAMESQQAGFAQQNSMQQAQFGQQNLMQGNAQNFQREQDATPLVPVEAQHMNELLAGRAQLTMLVTNGTIDQGTAMQMGQQIDQQLIPLMRRHQAAQERTRLQSQAGRQQEMESRIMRRQDPITGRVREYFMSDRGPIPFEFPDDPRPEIMDREAFDGLTRQEVEQGVQDQIRSQLREQGIDVPNNAPLDGIVPPEDYRRAVSHAQTQRFTSRAQQQRALEAYRAAASAVDREISTSQREALTNSRPWAPPAPFENNPEGIENYRNSLIERRYQHMRRQLGIPDHGAQGNQGGGAGNVQAQEQAFQALEQRIMGGGVGGAGGGNAAAPQAPAQVPEAQRRFQALTPEQREAVTEIWRSGSVGSGLRRRPVTLSEAISHVLGEGSDENLRLWIMPLTGRDPRTAPTPTGE
jgi:hypothetical protein